MHQDPARTTEVRQRHRVRRHHGSIVPSKLPPDGDTGLVVGRLTDITQAVDAVRPRSEAAIGYFEQQPAVELVKRESERVLSGLELLPRRARTQPTRRRELK